MFKEG
jgi:hypothetical protein